MTLYKIYLTKKTNKGNISRDESFITDGQMVTRHNNPNDTFRIWKEKKDKGEDVDFKRGILLEKFKGKTAKQIKEHVEEELKIMKEKLKNEVKVEWRIEKK